MRKNTQSSLYPHTNENKKQKTMIMSSDLNQDFNHLATIYSEFAKYVVQTKKSKGGKIDWKNPYALRELTKVLLHYNYGLNFDIPINHLCPPVPQRLNYIKWINELLDFLNSDFVKNHLLSTSTLSDINITKTITNTSKRIQDTKDLRSNNILSVGYRTGRFVSDNKNSILSVSDNTNINTKKTFKGIQDDENIVKGIDIGTGASCIFPLLGVKLFNYRFLATEICDSALKSAQKNIKINNYESYIELRQPPFKEFKQITPQPVPNHNKPQPLHREILSNVITPTDGVFDFTMCNPPFFSDIAQTGQNSARVTKATPNELVCAGGEHAFVSQLINESEIFSKQIRLFTTMIGRKTNLQSLTSNIKSLNNVFFVRTTSFEQGRQTRWGIAWSFTSFFKK